MPVAEQPESSAITVPSVSSWIWATPFGDGGAARTFVHVPAVNGSWEFAIPDQAVNASSAIPSVRNTFILNLSFFRLFETWLRMRSLDGLTLHRRASFRRLDRNLKVAGL